MRSNSTSRRPVGLLFAATIGLAAPLLLAAGPAAAEDLGSESQVTEAPLSEDGVVVLAASPASPFQNAPTILNGALELDFVDGAGAEPSVSYEARVNNGATPVALTTTVRNGRTIAVLGGLTNGQPYMIEVRALGGSGTTPSAWSNSRTATPRDSADAATGVTAVVGPSSINVSWSLPANMAGIVGFTAFASPVGVQHSGNTVTCDVSASVTSCVLPVEAGVVYDVAVISNETGGAFYPEQRSALATSAVVPAPSAPATLPAGAGTLTGPTGPLGNVVAGRSTTVVGTGFAPFTTVTLAVYPGPVVLGTVVTDQDGAFSTDVVVPTTLVDGTVSMTATGILGDGSLRTLRADVALSGGRPVLAATGFDAVPVAVGGGLVLLTGAGLLLGARRRTS